MVWKLAAEKYMMVVNCADRLAWGLGEKECRGLTYSQNESATR